MKTFIYITLIVLALALTAGCNGATGTFDSMDNWLQGVAGQPFGSNEAELKAWLGDEIFESMVNKKEDLTKLEGAFELAETARPISWDDSLFHWRVIAQKPVVDEMVISRAVLLSVRTSGSPEDKWLAHTAIMAQRIDDEEWKPVEIPQKKRDQMLLLAE